MNDHPGPPDESTETYRDSSPPPRRIGPYRLLEKLGEGGMGEVYLAEQETPVRRRVALKLIKVGMDTRQVVARFESERQALALMNHPDVAKVFDAGETPQGRPYFAMEYVKGVPIAEHCDRQRLTTGQRLTLFIQVCEGVQHAHQKGIIHRDLKPSNVLVSIEGDKAVPKIIDFGVAKATEQRLTEKTVFTELGQLVGTPAYMSPEQAEMTTQDIDTRTDVYSLGVMLYELLVGALPFDPKELRRAGFDEIRRKIREEEPSRPSTRISTLGAVSTESAKKRRTDPASLAKQLRGDLDWITMRALEKDRTRRYGSPAELAADIDRHLTSQPVLAGPPGAAYRARKFVRRHRLGVGITAVAGLVLLAFAVTMALQAKRIAAERDRANQERETADRVSEFLGNMLGTMEPERLGTTLMAALQEQVREVQESRGGSEQEIEAAVGSLEGVNGTNVALRVLDEEILARAGRTIEEELAEEPRIAGRLEHTLGDTYYSLGLYEASERHLLRAVEIREQELGEDHTETLMSVDSLAAVYLDQGRHDEAEQLYRRILETRRRVLGKDHPDTLTAMFRLAEDCWLSGRRDEATGLFRETFEARKRVLGADHQDTLRSKKRFAAALRLNGRAEDAAQLVGEALEAYRRTLGDDHPETLGTMDQLAVQYMMLRRNDEAEKLRNEAFEIRQRAHPDDEDPTVALTSMMQAGSTHWTEGRIDDAEKAYLEALSGYKRVRGDDHPETLNAAYVLAEFYANEGRPPDAERLLVEAVGIGRRALGNDNPTTLRLMARLAALYEELGRYDEAEKLLLERVETARRLYGDDSSSAARWIQRLGRFLEAKGDLEAAEARFREALDTARRVKPAGDVRIAQTLFMLGRNLIRQQRYADAEPVLRECLEIRRKAGNSMNPHTMSLLGESLSGQGKYEEAEHLLLEGYVAMNHWKANKREALERVVRHYEAWGKPDKAEEWRAKLSEAE